MEAKVDALIVDSASTSLTVFVALSFGEAGWKRVGGRSLGKAVLVRSREKWYSDKELTRLGESRESVRHG